MLIWTARFSKKKRVLCLLAIIVAAGAILLTSCHLRGNSAPKQAELQTNEDRIAYLASWGWEVSPEPLETFQLLLPEKLEEADVNYNTLQKAQGLDLSAACGKQVTRYTYTVTNYPDRTEGVQANLYICELLPVAGDLIVAGADGFQAGLSFPGKA